MAPSPFEPTPHGRPPGGGADENKDDKDDKEDKGDGPSLTVSLDGIAARVVPVPVPDARYSDLRAVKGGLVWLRRPLTGMLGLYPLERARRMVGLEPGQPRPRRVG